MGVRLVNLKSGDAVVATAKVFDSEEGEQPDQEAAATTTEPEST